MIDFLIFIAEWSVGLFIIAVVLISFISALFTRKKVDHG